MNTVINVANCENVSLFLFKSEFLLLKQVFPGLFYFPTSL